jgi:two-component system, chemotaxis family, sensor kinase CheA
MSPDRSFFSEFLDDYYAESEEHLTSARKLMLSIEAAGENKAVDPNLLDDLLRSFHSLKGLSAMVGLDEATQLSHHIEDFLKEFKRPNAVITANGIERVVDGIDAIERVVEAKRKTTEMPDISSVLLHLDVATKEAGDTPAPAVEAGAATWRFVFHPSAELAAKGVNVTLVRNRLRSIGDVIQASPRVLSGGQVVFEFLVKATAAQAEFEDLRSQGVEYSRTEQAPPIEKPKPQAVASEPQAGRVGGLNMIRVEMDRLDELMRVVGELVTSRFRLEEALRAPMDGSMGFGALEEINSSMENQLRELRECVVRIRMVPISQIFERMRFVARGMERELDKRIEVHIEGQDTEIDKVIVDRMMDPLLHLVRNAISHGLESPQERLAAGKPETGIIRLRAATAGDTVMIQVDDDGRGIDVEKIAARARSLGWIGADQSLDSKRLLSIISAPGFTTRDKADLSSGRGVGMAAVQTAVSQLGGSMSLTTTKGKGSAFTVNLPLTLLIADSLMVNVGPQRFAVPQTAVREVLAIDSSEVKILENNEVISFRGSVLPILRLARLFGLTEVSQSRLHLLVIADAGAALAVDRITGLREIVVRTITDPLLRTPGVVGATELGDGRPVLILDPHSLVRAARHSDTVDIAS